MAFEILERESVGDAAWDAFADASDEAWLWHLHAFQDTLATWPGLTDQSFAVRDEKKIVAIVPLHFRRGRFFGTLGGNSLESLGGPACVNGTEPRQRKKILGAVRSHLESLIFMRKARHVSLALPVLAPAWRGERCPRVNPLLDVGCHNALSQSWVVDLRRPLEQIRGAYSETTRQEIRKASQSGAEIREARGDAGLNAYYDLHIETCRRTGIVPRARPYFEKIFSEFVEKGLARILFLVRDGTVIAAHSTALYKNGAQYWTGASTGERAAGDNRLLMDDQILAARAQGCEWYEAGEAFPNLKGGKLKGLSDFKRGFGGDLYPFFQGRLPVESVSGRLALLYRAWRGAS